MGELVVAFAVIIILIIIVVVGAVITAVGARQSDLLLQK